MLIQEAFRVAQRGSRDELFEVLLDCVTQGTVEALAATEYLAKDDYGGFTMKIEFKTAAACCLFAWGKAGIDVLANIPSQAPSFSNYTMVMQILAQVAAGSYPPFQSWLSSSLIEALCPRLQRVDEISDAAESALNQIVADIPMEDDATSYAGHLLQTLSLYRDYVAGGPSRKLIAALGLRTLVVGVPVIQEYERLLVSARHDEPKLQQFFESRPLLLDPFAVRVWPQPDLHGKKEPDFMVQRADGSYLVVEIEVPGKSLVTAANQITAETTHAVTQALDYQDFLQRRFETAAKTFTDFRKPDALVIVGMEGELDEAQRAALQRENEGRTHLTIVGFDTLAARARAILANLTRGRVSVERVRLE